MLEINNEQRRETTNENSTTFEAKIAMSRQREAKKAGQECISNLINSMKNKPDLILLFATKHYKRERGFQQILDCAHEILHENTLIVGGVVPGFICKQGCFTRGVIAAGIYSNKCDFALGFGEETKRNPQKAAEQFSQMIKRKEFNSRRNSLIFELTSSSLVLDVPPLGKKKIIKSKSLGKILAELFGFLHYLQKGLGREDEVFEKICEELPDYDIIGGSAMDGMDFLFNYQFFVSV